MKAMQVASKVEAVELLATMPSGEVKLVVNVASQGASRNVLWPMVCAGVREATSMGHQGQVESAAPDG